MTPDDAQGQPEPTQSAETPAAEATQSQTAEGTKDAEAEFSPDEIPEANRGRLLKWADKIKAEYHRQEITRAGNWIANLPPEDRERIKKDPFALRKLEAQLEEARRSSGGNVGVRPAETRQTEASPNDGIEDEAAEILRDQGIHDDGSNDYKTLKKLEMARLRKVYARVEKVLEQKSESIANKATEKLTDNQIREQFLTVSNSEEWNHPEKGEEFQIAFRGLLSHYAASGKKMTPLAISEEAKKRVFKEAPPPPPKPKPSFGDKSNGKVGASAGADALEKFIQDNRAKGVDLESARWG